MDVLSKFVEIIIQMIGDVQKAQKKWSNVLIDEQSYFDDEYRSLIVF